MWRVEKHRFASEQVPTCLRVNAECAPAVLAVSGLCGEYSSNKLVDLRYFVLPNHCWPLCHGLSQCFVEKVHAQLSIPDVTPTTIGFLGFERPLNSFLYAHHAWEEVGARCGNHSRGRTNQSGLIAILS